MSRLDKEREAALTPRRLKFALDKLKDIPDITELKEDGKSILFKYKGETVLFWAYSGWFTGKGVVAGRGINNLLQQLK